MGRPAESSKKPEENGDHLFSLPHVGRAGVGVGRWFKRVTNNSFNAGATPTLTLPTRGREPK